MKKNDVVLSFPCKKTAGMTKEKDWIPAQKLVPAILSGEPDKKRTTAGMTNHRRIGVPPVIAAGMTNWRMRGNASAGGFARDGPAEEVYLSPQAVLHVVEHGRRVVGLGADLVHLPRVFVQRDAQCGSNALAFIDQVVQQAAQVAELTFDGELLAVR